ncbi:MAG: WG repeat-containing protein, partial [Deltaproteobacteria bacterium]|nr:WG repeat-containing protein [Deltaproteobacteria bacterium]
MSELKRLAISMLLFLAFWLPLASLAQESAVAGPPGKGFPGLSGAGSLEFAGTPLPGPPDIALPSPGDAGPIYPALGPNGLYGYANAGGLMVIDSRFQAANPFQPNGQAWVKLDGAYGLIDSQGRWVKEPTIKLLRVSSFFANGLAEAQAED